MRGEMEHGALDLNNVVFSYFDLNLECFDQPELRIYIDVEFWIENNTGLLNKVKIFIILSMRAQLPEFRQTN